MKDQSIRDNVFVTNRAPQHTTTISDRDLYCEYDNSDDFSVSKLKRDISVHLLDKTDLTLTFSIRNIHTSFANSLRRIMLSEIPTHAIELVRIKKYPSLYFIPEEILSHRLGLVPIFVPNIPIFNTEDNIYTNQTQSNNLLTFRQLQQLYNGINLTENEIINDNNSLCFTFYVNYSQVQQYNGSVHSSKLLWRPTTQEQIEYYNKNPDAIVPQPVFKDILITKLGVDQNLEIDCYTTKSIGKDHAKFSPVSTAWYKLYPSIVINYDFLNSRDSNSQEKIIQRLKTACPFDIFLYEKKKKTILVNDNNVLKCTMCRECTRSNLPDIENMEEVVLLRKKKNDFLFTIESTGIYSPEEIFIRALDILKNKALYIKEELSNKIDIE